METIIFTAIATAIAFVIAGAIFAKMAGSGLAAALVGVVFMFGVIDASNDHFGTLELKNLGGKTFVVEAKVSDSTGKKAFLLYDLKEKKNRVAQFDAYPPPGYQEKTTTDGTILITPTPGI